jgi:hypothetical protein
MENPFARLRAGALQRIRPGKKTGGLKQRNSGEASENKKIRRQTVAVGLLHPTCPIREDVSDWPRRQSPGTQTHGQVFWLGTAE